MSSMINTGNVVLIPYVETVNWAITGTGADYDAPSLATYLQQVGQLRSWRVNPTTDVTAFVGTLKSISFTATDIAPASGDSFVAFVGLKDVNGTIVAGPGPVTIAQAANGGAAEVNLSLILQLTPGVPVDFIVGATDASTATITQVRAVFEPAQ